MTRWASRADFEDSTSNETLQLTIAPLKDHDAFMGTPARIIDIRGHGTDVSIALRTRTETPNGAALSVLRVDTRLLGK
jgi:hypothetical protein